MQQVEPYTLDLSDVIRLSDEDIIKISAANPDLHIEQHADGRLEITVASGLASSARAVKIMIALGNWNEGRGVVFDSSAGFRLPNGAMRSPDAAWVLLGKWEALAKDQQEKFAPVVPDFIVEVRSPSDNLRALQRKMEEWMGNGVRLAWVIDPVGERAYVYRSGAPVEEVSYDSVLTGEEVLPGFSFDLKTLA